MRKIISLIMVLVLGVALVGSSAYAVNPDPNAVRPWICESRPEPGGDDDPFGVDKVGIRLFDVSAICTCLLGNEIGQFLLLITNWNLIQPNGEHDDGKDRDHPETAGE
ncbi:MAG: hypothetical protein ABIE70_01270 [bacterium]